MSVRKYAALYLGAALSLTASATCAESNQVFIGYTGSPDYDYGYVGDMYAVNHDLKSDGLLLRGSLGYGEYSFSSLAAHGNVDVNMDTADLMVGYQKFFNYLSGGRFAIYLGGNYQDHKLDRTDNTDPVRGNEFGAKGLAEMRLNLDQKTFVNLESDYSSAFNTYNANGHFGYNFGEFSFGPEVAFLGNQAYDQQRIGIFVGDIHITDDLSAGVSGGYEHTDRQLNSGAYVTVAAGLAF